MNPLSVNPAIVLDSVWSRHSRSVAQPRPRGRRAGRAGRAVSAARTARTALERAGH